MGVGLEYAQLYSGWRDFEVGDMLADAAGASCGLLVAIATVRLMSSLLFHVSAVDPVTYVAVCVGLLGTSALASYIPSRRAAGVDPIDALKAE